MPIYEYECSACGHHHEALQKVSDPLLTRCPACGEESLKKLISAAGFRLSGSGWYETDFKSGDKKNLHSKESEKRSTDSAKTDTKSADQKTAAKPASATTSSSGSSSS